MRKKITAIALLILCFSGLKAQDMIFTLDYNFGYPTGDFEKFTAEPAYRGGGINYTRFLNSNENIGIGFGLDWQGFYQKVPRSSFPFYANGSSTSTSDINAVQFRYTYTTPIMAGLDYYFIKDAGFLPYVGINLGIAYTEQELYVSAYDNEINTSWDFAYGVEAGFHLVFGESGLGLNLIGKYNMSTYSHTFSNVQFETKQGSYASVGIGLSFLMLNYY